MTVGYIIIYICIFLSTQINGAAKTRAVGTQRLMLMSSNHVTIISTASLVSTHLELFHIHLLAFSRETYQDFYTVLIGSCCDLREHECKPHNRGLNNKCYDDCMCEEGECHNKLILTITVILRTYIDIVFTVHIKRMPPEISNVV